MYSDREQSEDSEEVSHVFKAKHKKKNYHKKVETSWSHENILKLIQEVESRRSLWDVECAEYKLQRDLAWQEVADSIPATLNDCKAKWVNLRTTFHSNMHKWQKKTSGQGTDESVSIIWKYFKPMMFLKCKKSRLSRQSTSSMQLECSAADESFVSDFGLTDREQSEDSGEERHLFEAKKKKKDYRKKVETSWLHENILKLIQEVESRRSLWDVGCAEYKLPKDVAWQEVADSIPATFNDCKGKWTNLRTTFSCNMHKLQKKKSGQGSDETVSITWKYFKPMLFLANRQSNQSTLSMQPKCSVAEESLGIDFGISDDVPSQQQQKRKIETVMSVPSKISRPNNDLKSMCFTQSLPKDSFTTFGEYIACELKSLTPEQAVYAKAKLRRAFNKIMDEAILIVPQQSAPESDGVHDIDIEDKPQIVNTNDLVFQILNASGLNTAYVKAADDDAFIAKKCEIIPIEWVTRRLVTGSYLKRNPGVQEGYRFSTLKQETFFKDDAAHYDPPQWSDEQIISAKFKFNGLIIGQDEIDIIKKTSAVVFEILEKAWATKNFTLVDMKIEFGVDWQGNIALTDIIDSDCCRLWLSGDKSVMVDEQVDANMPIITDSGLETVKSNFIWINEQLEDIIPKYDHLVVILMDSVSDKAYCEKIADNCKKFGLNTELRVTSAHKGSDVSLHIVREYESVRNSLVFIAVACRTNGLGAVLSGNTTYPVINCPLVQPENMHIDWSSLNVPSGVGCPTVLNPEAAALHAAQIFGVRDFMIWSKLRTKQLNDFIKLKMADKGIRGVRNA